MVTDEDFATYCEKKEEEKVLKKSISALGTSIKQFFTENKTTNKQVGKWKVELQHRVSEDVNEAKMLDILQDFWEKEHPDKKCPFVQTVCILNMDALEGALYRGEIPEDVMTQLNACRIRKETDALVYSINKEEE